VYHDAFHACFTECIASKQTTRVSYVAQLEGKGKAISARFVPIIVDTDVTKVMRVSDNTLVAPSNSSLQHVQKMEIVGRLAGGMAHEVNNALAVIEPCIKQLIKHENDPVILKAYMLIEKAGQLAGNVVRQLLLFVIRFKRPSRPVKTATTIVC